MATEVMMTEEVKRFGEKELMYVKEVLDTGFSASKPSNMCGRLEESFARKVGAKYAITFNSGTSTMHACVAAAGIGPGDEVIVPALTVLATANVVLYQNAVPIFAEIDPDTFNIDTKDVECRITDRTKAIIPVSLYGLSPDMDPIMELAEKHNLTVIEDNAESPLAEYKGRKLGTIGHMGSFSFENSKHIVTGDGGIVTTNDKELATRLRAFSFGGYRVRSIDEGDARSARAVFQDPNYSRHDTFGWSYKMPEVACALGLAQMEKADLYIDKRIKIADLYAKAIVDCDWFTPQYTPEGYKNVFWTYAVKYDEKKSGVSWKDFREKYIEFGGDGIYAAWVPVYMEEVFQKGLFYGKGCPVKCSHYKGNVKYEKGLCPVTEEVQPKIMQFVTNYLSDDEAISKADALKKTIEYFS